MPSIEAPTEGILLRYAIDYATSRGCKVIKPGNPAQWLTPGEIGRKVGLQPAALNKRLKAASCPAFESERGKRRIVRILAHERLLAFLAQPKQPGRRLLTRFEYKP